MEKKYPLEKKIKQWNETHNNKYDYSLVEFTGFKNRITIICPDHGEFTQRTGAHSRGKGCGICGEIKKANSRSAPAASAFIEKAKKQHPQFDYSKTRYTRARCKVTITCPAHGDWNTDPTKFLISVVGCPECSRLCMIQLNREKTFGWNKETWVNKGLNARRFQSFKCYVIRCWNKSESFYKIGKTFNRINKRFSCNEDMPYKFEVVHLFEYADGGEAHDKEESLKVLNKNNSYIPKIHFAGMYECFSKIELS